MGRMLYGTKPLPKGYIRRSWDISKHLIYSVRQTTLYE